ncbi:Prefoldin subunit-domain-containing protein [Lasiosphaeris hirsuta]|uniref:Prefoldin subunit-domain-containing protein n=1 Tax=Lasiosphaeris hirsuta TaxID=260670 RepID=A0AA40B9Y2_9PEZI|nr:Prefoldin subunit-domain-containing protein [Lasiosphaeris hirsuta]
MTTMEQQRDHLSDLDRHVQLLEGKVNTLRASLNHWQQWYLEYSALKEEVEILPNNPPPRKELARIRRDFDSELLTKKEINEIFGKNDLKDADKIATQLSRRIDYVEKNIDSVRKLLEVDENKLAAAIVVAYPDGGTDEESGLPLTDIIEELDDNDNVVRSRLQTGGDAEPEILEALERVGIHDDFKREKDLPKKEVPQPTNVAKEGIKAGSTPAASATPKNSQKTAPSGVRPSSKKSVSFSEDTKEGHDLRKPPQSRADREVEQLRQAFMDLQNTDVSNAVIPKNESAEENALRRDMLAYSMQEIGPVVAELQLEEDYSDEGEDPDWYEIDEEIDDDEDEDEDEDDLGRTKHSVITGDYIKRMQELEKRLGATSAFAVHRQNPETGASEAGVGRISVVKESILGDGDGDTHTSMLPLREPKSVKSPNQQDIAEESTTRLAPKPKDKPRKLETSPIGDIVEKTTTPAVWEEPEEPEEPMKRVSRFKKERAAVSVAMAPPAATIPPGPLELRPRFHAETRAEPSTEPAPPEGVTVAFTVVERIVSSQPQEPDDTDDNILYQAAAVEYNRLRNKMIQKQGGFMKKEEEEIVEPEEEEGGPRRMSKFKAARLAMK